LSEYSFNDLNALPRPFFACVTMSASFLADGMALATAMRVSAHAEQAFFRVANRHHARG
jgi:hypothetical protein